MYSEGIGAIHSEGVWSQNVMSNPFLLCERPLNQMSLVEAFGSIIDSRSSADNGIYDLNYFLCKKKTST